MGNSNSQLVREVTVERPYVEVLMNDGLKHELDNLADPSCSWINYEPSKDTLLKNRSDVPTVRAYLKSERYVDEHPQEDLKLSDEELLFLARTDGSLEFLEDIRNISTMWEYFQGIVVKLYPKMTEADWTFIDEHAFPKKSQV